MVLYVVATPIGNLEDITLRAQKTLQKVDFICAENPRKSLRLLERHQIKTRVMPLSKLIQLLRAGHRVALVSDAGTPGISDPGSALVSEALQLGAEVIPIPGASALTTALSVAGIRGSRFLFMGFLPLKKRRNQALSMIINSSMPVVLYESPHRIIKTLSALPPQREVVVMRELTKIHETVYRGKIDDILSQIKARGEFVVVVK